MATIIMDELEVCTDCAAIAANGALGWDTDPLLAMTKLHFRKMTRVLGETEADNLVLAGAGGDDDDVIPYSTRECDGCGSTDAGERYPAAVLG